MPGHHRYSDVPACDRLSGRSALRHLLAGGLHAGDREYWKNQVEVFDADYRVVALDQAGHGEAGKGREAWTADSLTGDVEAVVKALGLARSSSATRWASRSRCWPPSGCRGRSSP